MTAGPVPTLDNDGELARFRFLTVRRCKASSETFDVISLVADPRNARRARASSHRAGTERLAELPEVSPSTLARPPRVERDSRDRARRRRRRRTKGTKSRGPFQPCLRSARNPRRAQSALAGSAWAETQRARAVPRVRRTKFARSV